MAGTLQSIAGTGWGDANMTVANQLAESMSDGWGALSDVWPQACTGLSLLSSIYIVGSNWLNKVSQPYEVVAMGRVAGLRDIACRLR